MKVSLASLAALAAIAALGTSVLTASAATKPPIKIAVTSLVDTPIVSYPQVFSGANAAARAINAKGGVNGRKIQIVTCNGRFDPNAEVACAKKAASDGAVAAVGTLAILNTGGVEKAFAAAKIANVGAVALTPDQYGQPVSFPIIYSTGQYVNCLNNVLTKAVGGARIAAMSVNDPVLLYQLKRFEAQASARKANYVGRVVFDQNATDLAPAVQQMSSHKPDIVVLIGRPDKNAAFMAASMTRGASWTYCNGDMNFGPGQILAMGQAAAKYYQGSALPPVTATKEYPELKKFLADMKAQQKAGDKFADTSQKTYYSAALNSWLGVQTVAKVASTMRGQVNNRTFLAAISKAKVDLGIVPPIDFSRPVAFGPEKRVFNRTILLEKWDVNKKQFVLVPSGQITLKGGR